MERSWARGRGDHSAGEHSGGKYDRAGEQRVNQTGGKVVLEGGVTLGQKMLLLRFMSRVSPNACELSAHRPSFCGMMSDQFN